MAEKITNDQTHVVRGGSIWKRANGTQVKVVRKRTVYPMESIRKHSDLRWRLVIFVFIDGGRTGGFAIMHEDDFRKQYEWVRGR